jgi:hypothetical protein
MYSCCLLSIAYRASLIFLICCFVFPCFLLLVFWSLFIYHFSFIVCLSCLCYSFFRSTWPAGFVILYLLLNFFLPSCLPFLVFCCFIQDAWHLFVFRYLVLSSLCSVVFFLYHVSVLLSRFYHFLSFLLGLYVCSVLM